MTLSNMDVRLFDFDKDYQDVKTWWTEQEWPAMPKELLSDTGFIAEIDGTKLAAVWVYSTNSPIYIMEWLVGNPEVDHEVRKAGIDAVVEVSSIFAKESGAKQLLTMTNNKRFMEKLDNLNFKRTDKDMIHFMRSL